MVASELVTAGPRRPMRLAYGYDLGLLPPHLDFELSALPLNARGRGYVAFGLHGLTCSQRIPPNRILCSPGNEVEYLRA
jgi:hypothetical protein